MSDRRRPRRHSWNRSQSDGFRSIRQVGLAYSVGFPLMVVGLFMLVFAVADGSTFLWILAGGLFGGGILAAASGRIT